VNERVSERVWVVGRVIVVCVCVWCVCECVCGCVCKEITT